MMADDDGIWKVKWGEEKQKQRNQNSKEESDPELRELVINAIIWLFASRIEVNAYVFGSIRFEVV